MLYLLDADVLIDANRDYYPLERVPEFWEWLEYNGQTGNIKVPVEVYEEIKKGTDELTDWVKRDNIKSALILVEEADVFAVRQAIEQGYAPDLTDIELEKVGRDPFVVSYALKNLDNRYIVTTEVSKPKRQRANRHIPDVCESLGIKCCNTFQFLRELDFRTNWKTNPR